MKLRRPDLGIMALRSASSERPFGESGYFKKLFGAARELKISVAVFSPEDIDWSRESIKGFTWNGKHWNISFCGFPRVVYDRIFHPAPKEAVAKLARLRKVPGVIFLNRSPSGKWEVYSHLAKALPVSRYLPETRRYLAWRDAMELMRRFKSIFFKPDFGTHGKGILRVVRIAPGVYRLDGRDRRNKAVRLIARGKAALEGMVGDWVSGRRYLVQRGLNLTGLDGRAFDLRVLAQKNKDGAWEVTGSAVRVGSAGSVTSNLHGGGEAEKPEKYLERIFGQPRTGEILQQINSMVIEVCRAMSAGGIFLELGLDIGVDTLGRIWLIEVNSKPGRRVFSKTGDQAARRDSIWRPVEYAAHVLAEKKRKGLPNGNPIS